MMETHITIPCQSIRLAGRINLNVDDIDSGTKKGVVITHPHPLYGGNMDNPVVMTIADAYYRAGFSTLRFNFRGTGLSSGMFDNGDGEMADVAAALSTLKDQGVTDLHLAGYSFGSWVNARLVSQGQDILDHVMVSPPAAFLSFDDVSALPHTGLIITGGEDDIAPPADIRSLIERWKIVPEFIVLASGDHFYSGHLDRLDAALATYLADV